MKTIMVIDGAVNCAYDCFLASDLLFARLFPGEGRDIEFIEDVRAREGRALDPEFAALWSRPVRKRGAQGLDGLLFYELPEKRRFYPTKRDSDLDGIGRPARADPRRP